jgi:hypothetical protein
MDVLIIRLCSGAWKDTDNLLKLYRVKAAW